MHYTMPLAEKLSAKIKHKHVSELYIIIAEKLPHRRMNHLCSWLPWQDRIQYPVILTFITALGEGDQNTGNVQTRTDRQATYYATKHNLLNLSWTLLGATDRYV